MSTPELDLDLTGHKLLIANRGEIAHRILRTAHRLHLPTLTLHTHPDSTSPHVLYSSPSHSPNSNSTSIALSPHVTDPTANSRAYLDGEQILEIARREGVTMLIPGYGFLSENAEFARKVVESEIIWLGPRPETIHSMGLKHLARQLALSAGVPVVPGSDGLVHDVDTAVEWGNKIGWPVMLKATGGGGGMGIVVCEGEEEMRGAFGEMGERAGVLFGEGMGGLFVEKYVKEARHVEVQIFGNGLGHCIHFGERECSVQRRRQKIIEETPSPFMLEHPDIRERMCADATRLCSQLNYTSAGTCEFIVDNQTGAYFFLELNARLQVEHTITEAVHSNSEHRLDLVELMIRQGIAEYDARAQGKLGGLPPSLLPQSKYGPVPKDKHAIQCRIYCEDPSRGFVPCPGVLQEVLWPPEGEGVRIDTWVSRGTQITPFYDPLVAKLILSSSSSSPSFSSFSASSSPSSSARSTTIQRLLSALSQTRLSGPPTNLPLLSTILRSPAFLSANFLTTTLSSLLSPHSSHSPHSSQPSHSSATPMTNFYTPHAISILEPGVASSIQQEPGRERKVGIPRGGCMDSVAAGLANLLVGNDVNMEVIEITLRGPRVLFWVGAVVSVTGAPSKLKIIGLGIDGREGKKEEREEREVGMWTRLVIRAGETLDIGMIGGGGGGGGKGGGGSGGGGYRAYLAVRGGFPGVPLYLGSKSTSLGVGGYQGRNLLPNDQLTLSPSCGPTPDELSSLFTLSTSTVQIPEEMRPVYPRVHTLMVIAGPHADEDFLTQEGLRVFFGVGWKVSPSSNRMGIRLEGPKLDWARKNGGMGGSHPSNILDNGYAYGAVNINGDTPVLLTADGPSMGGYLCLATVATGDMWRLGQLRPGDEVRFRRVSLRDAGRLEEWNDAYMQSISDVLTNSSGILESGNVKERHIDAFTPKHASRIPASPIIAIIPSNPETKRPKVVYRTAGDRFVLIEYGEEEVDLGVRARVHLFEREVERRKALCEGIGEEGEEGRRLRGVISLAPCVRSTMVTMDPNVVGQYELVQTLMEIERSLPDRLEGVVFPGRLLTLPIVLDDRWSRDAVQRYMRSSRNKASYLPNNIQYLAETNGLEGGAEEALQKLISSEWIVAGAGFYFDCPFLVPVDPRARLTGSKYNPSRTYTPRGAIGIAGPIAAIYPIESPGGYQLFGRTLPPWSPWGKGPDFSEEEPWLIRFFDQIRFEPVTEEEYEKLERDFDAGTYKFKIEDKPFVMNDYLRFIESIKDEVEVFRKKQARSVKEMADREDRLLKEWEDEKSVEAKKVASQGGDVDDDTTSPAIISTMAAAIWKIRVKSGDIISAADQVVITLEAMKTEIDVPAGEEFVGKKVRRVLVKEGQVVGSGDRLVIFD